MHRRIARLLASGCLLSALAVTTGCDAGHDAGGRVKPGPAGSGVPKGTDAVAAVEKSVPETPARPAPPRMKMTTEVPGGIITPERLETRIGTLTSFDGVPDPRTTELVYDNLDFQRGVHAMLSTLQIASLRAMREGMLSVGPANETVLVLEDLMDSKSLFLTANTTSVYAFMWLEMGDEPMVMETPPDVLGFVDDAFKDWMPKSLQETHQCSTHV